MHVYNFLYYLLNISLTNNNQNIKLAINIETRIVISYDLLRVSVIKNKPP